MNVIDFKDAKCRHCYKCVRHCGVKAISVQNGQAHIIPESCIHCGHCMEVCPQNAKVFASDMERVREYLRLGKKTVVSIAPSYVGILPYTKEGQVVDALMKLGFHAVRETAEGAALVTDQYQKLLDEGRMKNIITTCCPSVNDMIEKYYPECVPMMAPVVSPMIAHGRLIKQLYGPDTKVVFLGPCISKKQEAVGDARVQGAIDAILTFEEMMQWWQMEGIKLDECESQPMSNPSPHINRLYPIRGGVIQSVLEQRNQERVGAGKETLASTDKITYHKICVEGFSNCMKVLGAIRDGKISGCFIEANVCEGGCLKGPGSGAYQAIPIIGDLKVKEQATHQEQDFLATLKSEQLSKQFEDRRRYPQRYSDTQIREVLKSTGKYSDEDELNCGACGYSTCKEKAIAVLQGKAEVVMCMPYMLTKAESMSNVVMDVIPYMIFVIDGELRIRECNKQAQEFLKIGREEALRSYIFEFIEVEDIEETFRSRKSLLHKKVVLNQGKMIAEEKVVYIEETDSVLLILQDITKEEERKEQRFQLKMETVEMAHKVIEKQMLVSQEIAGLLGETTAQTKVILTKLADAVLREEEG